MKITVTVDASELYSEEDEKSFSEHLKDAIRWEVKAEVIKGFKEQLKEDYYEAIRTEINNGMKQMISDTLAELVKTEKIKKRYSNSELTTFAEYMKEELQTAFLNSSQLDAYFTKETRILTDRISKELKERYDLVFASGIVAKLKEYDMLKPDVAAIFIEDKKQS